MEEYSIIGKRLPRVDAPIKVTGEAKYAADLVMPGMLWAKIKRSPHAHARILNIDTSKAKNLQGVKAIITGKDPEFGEYMWGGGRAGSEVGRETAIAIDKVRFGGEPVAAVAAIDEEIAEEALGLIDVEYEELPGVFDPEKAMEEGAPLVHDEAPKNISFRFPMDYGNVEQGFRESDHIREDTFKTFRVRHGFIEPHAALSYWDVYGRLVHQASKQSPWFTYAILANFFKLPWNKVRLIQPFIGGGFGGKNAPYPLDFFAPLLSKRTGKPVKIVYSQEEVFTTCWRKHTFIVNIKTGVKRDGTLMAIEAHSIADGGAYTGVGALTMFLSGAYLTLPYRLPHLKYEAIRVFTNYPTSVAMQGHGIDHTRYAADVQLDMIAEELGIDPVEIRLKNAIPNEDYETINGVKLRTCGIKECIERASEASGWKEWQQKRRTQKGAIRQGLGIGCAPYITGARGGSRDARSCFIRIHEDGSVSLITGAQDVGQGSDTIMAQIVAEELGLTLEDVQVAHIDTLSTPIDLATAASAVTFVAGHATRNAVLDVKKQLQEFGAKMWGVRPEEVEMKGHTAFVKGDPKKKMPWRRFIRTACYGTEAMELLGRGYYATNLEPVDLRHGYGQHCHVYSFAADTAKVEVNTETGEVKVIDFVAAHDCGRPLNPLAVEGQVDQQVSHGVGMTLFEDNMRENGRILNPTFLDYKMSRAPDLPRPKIIDVITNDPLGPYGAKEGSEAVQVASTPAIINAIHDATGVWIKELPATAEKVLKALKEKERAQK